MAARPWSDGPRTSRGITPGPMARLKLPSRPECVRSTRDDVAHNQRPKSFWEALLASEYGFWANVNPEVPHPRWSHATEELIGMGGERRPTLLFNGYGEYVAHLYKDLAGERLWA